MIKFDELHMKCALTCKNWEGTYSKLKRKGTELLHFLVCIVITMFMFRRKGKELVLPTHLIFNTQTMHSMRKTNSINGVLLASISNNEFAVVYNTSNCVKSHMTKRKTKPRPITYSSYRNSCNIYIAVG